MRETTDAVVIGAGHNGLVTAAVLADAGWDVLVLEGRDKTGGAVASVTRDGWVMDEFSACYPLGLSSPVLRALDLEAQGLRWARTDDVVAHVGRPDDTEGALIHRDVEKTARLLAQDHPTDGDSWLEMVAAYERVKDPLFEALLTRWPPVVPGARLAAAAGLDGVSRLARLGLLSVERLGVETFRGEQGRSLLAGNALHADIPPDAPGSGLMGWLMAMMAQDVGFPAPEGGAGELARALTSRATSGGARVETGESVSSIVVGAGRAVGVRTAGGREIAARRAVISDGSAPALYRDLLPRHAVPSRLLRELDTSFEWDLPTVKLNLRLSGPLPWTAQRARPASVVHVGADTAGLLEWSADLAAGRVPEQPFALLGQMTTLDPTRSPAGTETVWVYSHLPRGVGDDASADRLARALERMLDRFAPGWRDLVVESWVQRPSDLTAANPNLVGGAVGGGTAQLFQQAVFRPVRGPGGPRTPVERLYLGSAAIHPGGGVHGGPGYLAARAALADSAWWGRPRQRAELALLHHLYGRPD